MTTNQDAIEAGAQALCAGSNYTFPLEATHDATVAYNAMFPIIAAQAKVEAWDAVIARIDLGTPHMVDEKYVAGANWVRAQIEDVLKPAVTDGKES